MHVGRYEIGTKVPLTLWCRDNVGTPTMPDANPLATVWSETDKIADFKMPVHDPYRMDGLFKHGLYLGLGAYEPGRYRVLYHYIIGGNFYMGVDEFDVVAGGSDDGTGISMFFYRQPKSDFVLIQSEGGRLLRKRNPQLP